MSSAVTSVLRRSRTSVKSPPPRALRSTVSTLSASITMLPTLRVNFSRSPKASTVKVSLAPEPLKRMVSAPARPSIESLPSPGSQMNVSSPAPRLAASAPWLPSTVSFPGPATKFLFAAPPTSVSSPSLPRRETGSSKGALRAVHLQRVVAGAPTDHDRVESAAEDGRLGGAVIAEVDLEQVRLHQGDAERDQVVGSSAVDEEHAVHDRGLHPGLGSARCGAGGSAMPRPPITVAPIAVATTPVRAPTTSGGGMAGHR